MKRVSALFAILSLFLVSTVRAGLIPLPVANASFEVDSTSFFANLTPTDWTFLPGASGGVFRPLNAFNGGNGNFMDPTQFPPTQGAPDKDQVAFVTGGAMSQITSTASFAGGVYTLDVWAGTQNNIGGTGSSFSVGLYENGLQFASFSGIAPVNHYIPISISGIAPAGGGLLEIRLTGNGQTLFDNVQLFAPEPSSIVLAGLGAMGLVCCGLRKRRTTPKA